MTLPAGFSKVRLTDVDAVLDVQNQLVGFLDPDGSWSGVPRLSADGTSLVSGDGDSLMLPTAALAAKFGAADARLDLQSAIDYVGNFNGGAGGVLQLGAGTFFLSRNSVSNPYALLVPSRVRIRGYRGLTKLKLLDSTEDGTAVIRTVTDGENIWFEWLEIDGNKSRIASGQRGVAENEGINFKNVTYGGVRRCYIHDCAQDAIDYDGGSLGWIVENRLVDNSGCGVHAVGTSANLPGLWVLGNYSSGNNIDRLTNSGLAGNTSGISVGGGRRDAVVANNVSKGDARGIDIGSVTLCSVVGNVIEDSIIVSTDTAASIRVNDAGAAHVTISGNVIRGKSATPGVGIELGTGIGMHVSGNEVFGCSTNYLINGATAPKISGGFSYGSGNTTHGLRVQSASGQWVVSGLHMDGGSWGAYVEAGNGSLIGCSVNGVSEQGFDIRGAISGVNVIDPVTTSVSKYGVRMLSSPTNCVVKGGSLSGTSGPIQTTGTGHLLDVDCAGTPEAQLHAAIGSRAYRMDGGASTALYVKESGTGNTGWAAK